MSNDSTTGGYLQPSGGNALDDQALDRAFHDLVMNLTGLAAQLILPRWQEGPPNMPPNGMSWIAQGVTERRDDVFAWKEWNPGSQTYTLNRNQELDNLVSFYGPNSSTVQALFRDNIAIDQNRDVINALGIALVKVGDPRNLSMQINERWQKRIDVVVTFRRLIWRTYPVDSLLSAPIIVSTDTGLVDNVTAS